MSPDSQGMARTKQTIRKQENVNHGPSSTDGGHDSGSSQRRCTESESSSE